MRIQADKFEKHQRIISEKLEKCGCVTCECECSCEKINAAKLCSLSIYQYSQFTHLRHFALNLMAASDCQARCWLARKQLVAWAANNQILVEHEALQSKYFEGLQKNKNIIERNQIMQNKHAAEIKQF